jgi:hypothetical protein
MRHFVSRYYGTNVNELISFVQGMRLLKNLISDTDSRVKDYSDAFDKLLQQFRDRAAGDTLVVVHRIWKDIEAQGSTFSDLMLRLL